LVTSTAVVSTSDSFQDIALSFNFSTQFDRRIIRLLIEYFLILTSIVFIGRYVILDHQINSSFSIIILAQLIPASLFLSIQALFEEIAWSGWLFSKLQNLQPYSRDIIITLIWTFWHLPFFIWTDQLISLDSFQIWFIIFIVIQLLVSRIVYNWFRSKSKGVLVATIAHGLANTSGFLIGSLLKVDSTFPEYYIMYFILLANILFLVRIKYNPKVKNFK
jgi:membrane protease YdiL (CAAX protease family)